MLKTITEFTKDSSVIEFGGAPVVISVTSGSNEIGPIWSEGPVTIESQGGNAGISLSIFSMERWGLRSGDLTANCGILAPYGKISSSSILVSPGASITAETIRVYGDLLVSEGAKVEAKNIFVYGSLAAEDNSMVIAHTRMVCGGDGLVGAKTVTGNAFYNMAGLVETGLTYQTMCNSMSKITDDVVSFIASVSGERMSDAKKAELKEFKPVYLGGAYYRIVQKNSGKFAQRSMQTPEILIAYRSFLDLVKKRNTRPERAKTVAKQFRVIG